MLCLKLRFQKHTAGEKSVYWFPKTCLWVPRNLFNGSQLNWEEETRMSRLSKAENGTELKSNICAETLWARAPAHILRFGVRKRHERLCKVTDLTRLVLRGGRLRWTKLHQIAEPLPLSLEWKPKVTYGATAWVWSTFLCSNTTPVGHTPLTSHTAAEVLLASCGKGHCLIVLNTSSYLNVLKDANESLRWALSDVWVYYPLSLAEANHGHFRQSPARTKGRHSRELCLLPLRLFSLLSGRSGPCLHRPSSPFTYGKHRPDSAPRSAPVS